MLKYLHIVAIVLLGSLFVDAQTQSFAGYIDAGDEATAKQNHYSAYRLYALASESGWSEDRDYEERLSEVYYKAGLSAYRATAYAQAEKYFLLVLNRADAKKYELAYYYLAQSMFRQGRYDDAEDYYNLFIDENPDAVNRVVEKMSDVDTRPFEETLKANARFIEKAKQQIDDANEALNRMSRQDEIVLRHLPTGINTEDSDVMYVYGPGKSRFYSSNTEEFKKDTLTPKRSLYRIMERTGETTAQALPQLINKESKNVAYAAFNETKNRVYYSVCDFRKYDELRCDLYAADVSSDGKWSNPRMLEINAAGYSTGQPAVGKVNDTGTEYLFFSSDRPGGKGGFDLYRAQLASDGKPGAVELLEDLNTEDDDVSPYWYNKWQTLYFATNGRFSFGGLDIYKSFFNGSNFRDPVNLGLPVNSSADDAYYSRYDDADQAYVSSRRASAEALYYSDEKDVCCYDIYEFVPDPRITLRALAFNKLTQEELEGVTVKLCEITPSGPKEIDEITNLTANDFDFQVTPGAKYQLKATKDGFTSVIDEFDLSDPEFVDVPYIERRLELAPKIDLDVFTFNNVDQKALPGTTVSLYEVMDDGERVLVEEITNPTANDAHFELEIGKRYEIEGRKPGFGVAYDEVDVSDIDPDNYEPTIRRDLYLGQQLDVFVIDSKTDLPLNNATVILNRVNGPAGTPKTNPNGNNFDYIVNLNQDFVLEVSRKGYFPRTIPLRFTPADVERFDGKLSVTVPLISNDINDYLDLRVYFDNDHPDPDAYSNTTRLAYDETYRAYIDRREEFVKLAGQGLEGREAIVATGDVDDFFTEEVVPGYDDLIKLADALIVHMENGRSYQIKLVGRASPRAPTSYNLRLSARRNVSLMNFFKRYQDGALAEYIKNNTLTFSAERKGEVTDLDKIYELIDQERTSIYSVEASLARRVEFPKIFTDNSKK